jgi:putative flippase GtrA
VSAQAFRALFGKQFLVFVVGGLLTAVLDIGTMAMLLHKGTSVSTATSSGFALGLAANYFFHARLTFDSQTSRGSILRFLTVVLANYLITLVFVFVGKLVLSSPTVGKVISLPFIAANGFLLSKYWAFRST